MYVKVHNVAGEVLVAACDRELLGGKILHEDVEIDVSASFYGNNIVSAHDLTAAIQDASVVNLLGNRVVEHAVREGLLDEDIVMELGGVKHAQIVVV